MYSDLLSLNLAKKNQTLREHNDSLKNKAKTLYDLNYISKDKYRILKIASEYHDYGKLNKEFQNRLLSKKKFDSDNEISHNLLSLLYIPNDIYKNEAEKTSINYAILNHHHYINNIEELEKKRKKINEYAEQQNLNNFISLKLIDQLKNHAPDAIVLTGLLNKCDYSASGDYEIEYPNNFLISSMKNLNYKWNDLQKYMIDNTDKNLIVVANTGMGKTEAGLLWIGNNKGFFILPLKTAINVIYKRIVENIIKKDIEVKIALMHSESFSFYLSYYNETNNQIKTHNDIKDLIHEGKNLSIPLTVSTLDQIFNFVFKYSGYEMKFATLSYSKIVIDEIQAYSPDLLAYIVVGLKRITDVGGKFTILTATLPPYIRKYLENEIGKIEYKTFLKGKNRHNLKVLNEKINAEFIGTHFKKNGGKSLIVCNTIKKAQEIYTNLKNMEIENIELLHSKFLKKDRKNKEKDILEFGKTSNKGNKIWITTSIVEASLDIDFDYLFTELNDLSGLFQRLGRVNRKGEKEDMLLNPNAFVFTLIDDNLFLSENRERGFIDNGIFNLSKKALGDVDGIISEEKKYQLIEKYLTYESIVNENFNKHFNKIKNGIISLGTSNPLSLSEVKNMFRNIVSYKVIPEKVYLENKEIIDNLKMVADTELKKKIELDEYTLSVGLYDIKGNETKFDIKLKNEKIQVIKGNYSYEKGFERNISKNFNNENDNFS